MQYLKRDMLIAEDVAQKYFQGFNWKFMEH